MGGHHLTLVGNFTEDVLASGLAPGGSVFYGAAAARALGAVPCVWAGVGRGFDVSRVLPVTGDLLYLQRSGKTARFENRYDQGERTQWLRVRGPRIAWDPKVAEQVNSGPLLLCPVFDELTGDVTRRMRGRVTGVGIQGWLRRADEDERVHPHHDFAFLEDLGGCDVIFYSEEDIAGVPEAREAFCETVPVVVETRGAKGATVWMRGAPHWMAGTPVPEVDPTGAGDTFATAFLLYFSHHGDPLAAARFACGVAARVVSHAGPLVAAALSGRAELAGSWRRDQPVA